MMFHVGGTNTYLYVVVFVVTSELSIYLQSRKKIDVSVRMEVKEK